MLKSKFGMLSWISSGFVSKHCLRQGLNLTLLPLLGSTASPLAATAKRRSASSNVSSETVTLICTDCEWISMIVRPFLPPSFMKCSLMNPRPKFALSSSNRRPFGHIKTAMSAVTFVSGYLAVQYLSSSVHNLVCRSEYDILISTTRVFVLKRYQNRHILYKLAYP